VKKFVAAVLLLLAASCTPPAHAEPYGHDRASMVKNYEKSMNLEAKKEGHKGLKMIVEDTGQSMDLGEGEGPVVIVKVPSKGHECLVALHPKEQLSAIIGCAPMEQVSPKHRM
jgi:hypothetical protein